MYLSEGQVPQKVNVKPCIQCLIEEFQGVHDSNVENMFHSLRDELMKLNISVTDINTIIGNLNKSNLLRLYNEGDFRSDGTRKTYFKNNLNYVPPKQVYLGKNSKGNNCFSQYVPIAETIKALMSHESMKLKQRQQNHMIHICWRM